MRALSIAARSTGLRDVLARQSFTDWQVADETGAAFSGDDLAVFRDHPARCYLLSADDDALAAAMVTRGTLLYWLVRAEIDQAGLVLIESSAGGYAGAIFSREALRYHESFPRRAALVADLIDHMNAIGARVGSMMATDQPIAAPAESGDGTWRKSLRIDDASDGAAPPAEPLLFTCTSNDIYGDATILRAYCDVREVLPIVGRVQHGWEPGPGVVIQAMHKTLFDRYYVWSPLAMARLALLRVETEPHGKVVLGDPGDIDPATLRLIPIGAPYLYLPELADLGPIAADRLLAVPGHGIVASPNRAKPWAEYLSAVRRFAEPRGFTHVTVLVYSQDDTLESRTAIREAGFGIATCGNVNHPAYLLRLRDFLRRHAAVTSDRLCTAGMYALYENRPFYIAGAGTVVHDPPDAYADLVCDPAWIATHYPGISAGALAGRAEAMRDLGDRLPPGTLRRTLYSWIWDE